jgi:hypothetical protein
MQFTSLYANIYHTYILTALFLKQHLCDYHAVGGMENLYQN